MAPRNKATSVDFSAGHVAPHRVKRDILLTEEMAHAFVTTHAYTSQRPIVKAHVKSLGAQILAGHVDGDVIVLMHGVLPDGRRYLINGYHTCYGMMTAAILARKRGLPPPSLSTNLLELACADMAAVNDHYAKIDKGKSRTPTASALAHGFDLGSNSKMMPIYLAAIKILMRGFVASHDDSRNLILKDEDIMLLVKRDWAPFAQFYFALTNEIEERNNRRPFLSAGVLAIAMSIIRYAKGKSGKDFWQNVVVPETTKKGDPELALANKLRSLADSTSIKHGKTTSIEPTVFAHLAVVAWNHKQAGDRLDALKMPTSSQLRKPLHAVNIPQFDGVNVNMPVVPDLDIQATMDLLDDIELPPMLRGDNPLLHQQQVHG